MTLNSKLAFEIWAGIVALVLVVGGAAGVTLLLGDQDVASLVRTQVNNPNSSFASESDINGAALGITGAILGGSIKP